MSISLNSRRGMTVSAVLLSSALFAATPALSQDEEEVLMDPVTEQAFEQLLNSDTVLRQLELNDSIILFDREIEQISRIESLLGFYGPNAEIEIAPGEYRSYADTPVGIRAEIERINLERELQSARADLEEDERERRQAEIDFETEQEEQRLELQRQQLELEQQRREARLEEARMRAEQLQQQASGGAPVEGAPAPAAPVVSLREVFGVGDQLTAVLSVNGERIRVQEQEVLPGDVEILEIGHTSVTYRLGAEEFELHIRG